MKVTIEKVDNGYIVHVLETGLSMLKDPYVKPTLVFKTLQGVMRYLKTMAYGREDK